jgi:hypothetical protein
VVGVDVWLGVGCVSLGDGRADREGITVRDGLGDHDGVRVDDGVTAGAEGVGAGLSAGCTDPAGSGRTST